MRAQGGKSFFPGLNGLRAIAAYSVLIQHYYQIIRLSDYQFVWSPPASFFSELCVIREVWRYPVLCFKWFFDYLFTIARTR